LKRKPIEGTSSQELEDDDDAGMNLSGTSIIGLPGTYFR
jgi:hypothetical protein